MEFLRRLNFTGRPRLPLLLQTEATECGLACLAMVAGYHGHQTDLATLRRQHAVSLKGATLAQLIRIADRMKMATRPLRLDLADLRKLRLPAILHWDLNHFVVLKAVRGNRIVVHDPGRGERRLSLDEVSPHFTGVALELTPTREFQKVEENERVGLRDIWKNTHGLKGALAQVLGLSLALQVFALISPFFMQLTVDQAILSGDVDLLTVLGIGFLLVVLLRVAVEALRSWVLLYLGTTLNFQLINNLFRHLLRLPAGFFEKRHVGDVVSRFGSINEIQKTLTTSLVAAIIDGLMAVTTAVMMAVYSPMLLAIVLASVLLYAIFRAATFRALREANEEKIVRKAKEDTNFLETVRGVTSVKLFGAESKRQSRWQNLVADRFNASIRVQRLTIGFSAFNGIVFGSQNIAVIWIGALIVLEGNFSVGMLYAFMNYKGQFTDRAIGLIEKWIELRMLGLHLERVSDIALSDPEEALDIDVAVPESCRREPARLEVSDLTFRYASDDVPVLNRFSMQVEPGESVALVGPSGAGKTTLAKVLVGLLSPERGQILFDGADIRRLGLGAYRREVGAVMQDDQLFAGSLGENIAFFDEHHDQERVERSAALAAIHDDIESMPMGYDTLVGDMGTVLSGGQKQRLLLARALYREPRLLVLDEATSHLDVARERQVNEAVRRLETTRLIIAHRPETIDSADRVVELAAEPDSKSATA